MVLGVYITYKILDIADLTVDGSFALGSVVCALLIVKYDMNPLLAALLAGAAGMAAGAVTGFLHTVCGIPAILAGDFHPAGSLVCESEDPGRCQQYADPEKGYHFQCMGG